MEQRNEPSTEIVEEITNQSTTNDIIVVLKMIVQYLESFTMDKMSRDVMSAAADRLESQERTIADKDAKIVMLTEKVEVLENDLINFDMNLTEMTARAEQAERELDEERQEHANDLFRQDHAEERIEKAEKERDAAIADLDALKDSGFCNSCVGCNAQHSESITYCTDWKRRGLPQEGEGK